MYMAPPVIDFAQYGLLGCKEPRSFSDDDLRELGSKVCLALEEDGIIYLLNHGVPDELLKRAFASTKSFFESPTEFKERYKTNPPSCYNGWADPASEDLGYLKRGQYCETYKIYTRWSESGEDLLKKVSPPESEVAGFRTSFEDLQEFGAELTRRFMDVAAIGLGLERDFFSKHVTKPGTVDSTFSMRANYYPPMSPGQASRRLGEHTDFGCFTFLFTDSPGLELYDHKARTWSAVPLVDGTCVVIAGDLMQRWTADRFKACRHRVVVPSTEEERRAPRQSLGIFGNCDDILITCFDGSNKYPPFLARDHVDARLRGMYGY